MNRQSSQASWLGAVAIAVGLSGCEAITEAVDPCSREGACVVEGVDLKFKSMSSDAEMITEINKRAVPVGTSVKASYEIINQGSEPSTATSLHVCIRDECTASTKTVSVPALDPGETFKGDVQITIPDGHWGDDAVRFELETSDVNNDNHWNQDDLLLIERPDFKSAIKPLVTEIKAGTTMPVEISIRNEAYVTAAPGQQSNICFLAGSYYWDCMSGIEAQRITVPGLPPGAIHVDTLQFPVPLTVLNHHDVPRDRLVSVCADVTDVVKERDDQDNCAQSGTTVLPNLEVACTVQPIAVGQLMAGTFEAGDCDLSFISKVDLYSFTATANMTYTLTSERNVRIGILSERGTALVMSDNHWASATPATATFIPSTSGIYYIALSQYSNATYRVTLSQK